LVSGFRNGILEADYDLRDAICQRLQQKIAMSDTALLVFALRRAHLRARARYKRH